jgi:hypothetical protein
MIGMVLVVTAALTAQTAGAPKDTALRAEAAAASAETARDEAMAQYGAMKEKTPGTASAQWRLALWCEKRGLKPEAYVHFSEVARLDPGRDAVWKKLGFKKVGGRWLTDDQIAEEAEQQKADKAWKPRLKRMHKDLHQAENSERRQRAQAELSSITEPRAALPLYREFGGGGESDQLILIQALGQIDTPISTKILTLLSMDGCTPGVQRRATETLRSRPPEDFLDLLVGRMIDTIEYQVKRVGGPGSPGAIFVEGEQFNVARLYAPPPVPYIGLGPGDILSTDAYGMPVINRPIGALPSASQTRGVPGSKTLVETTTTETTVYATISPFRLMQEAQRSALVAAAQLEQDLSQIKAVNQERKQYNDRLMAIAKDATGKDPGRSPKAWREALAARRNSTRVPERDPEKPVLPQVVPLAYNPVYGPIGFQAQSVVQTRVYVDS